MDRKGKRKEKEKEKAIFNNNNKKKNLQDKLVQQQSLARPRYRPISELNNNTMSAIKEKKKNEKILRDLNKAIHNQGWR